MKIAVLGTGMVGQTLAGRLAGLGHEVSVGTRDVEATLARTEPDGMGNPPYRASAQEHPEVRLVTFAEAAAGAGFVVNATSGAVSSLALTAAGAENLAGKVLLDVANPLDFSRGFPPTLFVKDTDSAKKTVIALLEAFGHTDVIDLGDLSTARGTEMLLPVWVRLMGALNTPYLNFKIIR